MLTIVGSKASGTVDMTLRYDSRMPLSRMNICCDEQRRGKTVLEPTAY